MDLPRVRRYRKGAIDRLYVEDVEGLTYGWADATTGDITIQIPGSEARVEAAFEAWAYTYPDDDLATHVPGRNTRSLAAAWQAEIDALDEDVLTLYDMREHATYQRDQYLKGNSGEERIGTRLNRLYEHGWGILHAIPLYDGRADIYHLLIGPGGVWTINAKSHGSLPIRVNGDRMSVGRTFVDHIAAARREAAVVTRTINAAGLVAPVRPAVALDIAPMTDFHVVAEPEGVVIDRVECVCAEIERSEAVLSQSEVNTLFAMLRQRTTWEDSL